MSEKNAPRPHPPVPLTGAPCSCKPGVWRDNCPNCEGSGRAIDWRAYHAARAADYARLCDCEAEGCTHRPAGCDKTATARLVAFGHAAYLCDSCGEGLRLSGEVTEDRPIHTGGAA